ncbi:CHAP domain-containing protein, partial [Spirillospora albida]|uniref:CHAP domain-containing protein n=1 Tax=Spirillospora albida TaxID=58123 RepID=UPI00068F91AB
MSILNITLAPRTRRGLMVGLAATAAAGSLISAPAAQAATPKGAQRMVAIAKSQVGIGERKGASKYGTWYGRSFGKAPWCDMFVSWVARQAGVSGKVGRFAYTPAHAQWFKSKGRFDRKPRVGDLVFFDWKGSRHISRIDHVGLVTKVNRNGTVTTVEGNVSDKVMVRTRTMGTIVGFGHPKY